MIDEINVEREKSDRLTVAKLNAVEQFDKQDYKSKLMTEKYSLLPLNPQQLAPVQTAIQRMSEKHLDFEIEPVNTIRPPGIEYTQTPQALVPIDTPLSIIRKQSDIDKIVKNIETQVIHSLELLIQAQDLVKAYQLSTHFVTFINTSQMENFHPAQKRKIVSEPKHLITSLSTTFCLG